MRVITIFKVSWIEAERGTLIAWGKSEKECREIFEKNKAEADAQICSIHEYYMKPSREGLITFLSSFTDNG